MHFFSRSLSVLGLAVMPFAAVQAVPTAATWIAGDGNYSVSSNWAQNIVPNNNASIDTYVVTIDNNADVTLDSGIAVAVDTLNLISGNTLTVSGIGTGFDTVVSAFIDGTSLFSKSGGQMTLNATSWTGTSGFNLDRELSADGAGSVLDLSSLTTLVRNSGNANVLTLKASNGGLLDLSGLSAISDHPDGNGGLQVTADDAGSQVDISGISQISGAGLSALNGGEISGQLTDINASTVTVRNTGLLDLSLLADGSNSTFIAEDGAVVDLHTANIDQSSLIVRKGFLGSGGAQISTDVTTWTGTSGFNLDRELSADGAGSVLDLSSLTTLVRNSGNANVLTIKATDGGLVDLSGLSEFTDHPDGNGGLQVTADDAGSQVDISGISQVSGLGLSALNGGEVSGQLTDINASTVTVRNTGLLDLSLLADGSNSTFIAEDGAVVDLHSANIDQSSLIARKGFLGSGGAQISTDVASWTGTSGFNLDRELSADGAGSVLDLSSLTTLVRNSGNSNVLTIKATDGGLVDLSGLSEFSDHPDGNGGLQVTADGAVSQVDISGISQVSGLGLSALNGGEVSGQLTDINDSTVTVRNIGLLDLSLLADGSNSTFIAEDGAVVDLHTANIDQSSLIVRKGFLGSGGAQISTDVTTWTGTSGFNLDRELSADGAGSVLDLSSLTTLVRNSGNANVLTIKATDGGLVDLSGLSEFSDHPDGNGGLQVTADGAVSQVDISGISQVSGLGLSALNGGEVSGQLTDINDSTVTVRNIGLLDLSLLADGSNSTFIAEDGAVVDLHTANIDQSSLIVRKGFLGSGGAQISTDVTTWTGTSGFNLDRELSADGAGSVLDLSSLSTLVRNSGNANVLTIKATDGGLVDLSGLSEFSDHVDGNGGLQVTADGAGSQIDISGISQVNGTGISALNGGEILGQLTDINASTVTVRNTGQLDLGLLADGTGSTFIAEDGASIDLHTANIDQSSLIAREGFQGSGGAVVSTDVSSWTGTSGFNLDREFSADGAGSLVDLSTVTHLERNAGGSNELRITATEGGMVRLNAISEFADTSTAEPNGRVSISASDSGSSVDLGQLTRLHHGSVSLDKGAGVVLDNLATLEDSTITMDDTASAQNLQVSNSLTLIDGTIDMNDSVASLLIGTANGTGIVAGAVVVQDGMLAGTGEILGDLINGGMVAPGQSPGTLTIDGDFTQTANGLLDMEISATDSDLLDITGLATLDGTLEVTLTSGLDIDVGDTITIISALGGISGSFAAVEFFGFEGSVIYGADFVDIQIAAVPLPAAAWLLASGLFGLILHGRRRS